jgi:hypothetical protein
MGDGFKEDSGEGEFGDGVGSLHALQTCWVDMLLGMDGVLCRGKVLK